MAPLIILFLILAYTDLLHTTFMLNRYGLGIELNPLIPWLAQRFGLAIGVFLGITVPTLSLLFVGIYFRPLLEFIVLARLMLFFLQANTLRNELGLNPKRPRPTFRRTA